MAKQKHTFSDLNASSAPSPPARERIPPSFESRERTRTSSPISSASSASTIVHGFASAGSTGSDSNLNRTFSTNGSMRQQLLRRLWHKEYRRLDRTGSLSPPLHRSLRTKRTFRMQDTSPEVCSECERLEMTRFNRSVPEIAMKHIKHTNSLSHPKISSSASSLSFVRKSFIETETPNEQSPMAISSVSSERKSPPVPIDITTTNTTAELDTTANILNQLNGNLVNEDQINGNDSSQANGENSFLIEMEGDQINITTMAAAESTAISESTLPNSSDKSYQRELLSESAISQTSTNQWYDNPSNDGNNNYTVHSENNSKSKITEITHMKSGTYEAYHMSSGEIDIENESVVRLKTITAHEPLDQTQIDTIISQILVDSLNNIIVVQGKGNQSDSNGDNNIVELNTSQTQTENTVMMQKIDSHVSNSSPLPLPVTDKMYFPHYMSSEMLSEYSTKLSDNSNDAIDFLPSNLVISVISGSPYPGDGGEIVVHRITDMSRTESMEVQPSSAPSVHADDENGNPMTERTTKTTTTAAEEDEDATSLVDSLDDPNAIANVREFESMSNDLKVVEKSQAFFVPIENSDANSEKIATPTDLNAPIAETMPERLRERLQKRQMEIVERKEAEIKRRQEKIQKLIGQHGKTKSSSDGNASTSSFAVIPDESPKTMKKSTKSIVKKGNKLKEEIGSLESYTVDGQGNLKFVEGGKKSKITTISGPVVKHVSVKKTITTNKPLAIGKKHRENTDSEKASAEKRIKVTSNTTKTYQSKKIVSHKTAKDVQKMTLGQHSPSDIITPDRDCGPRRMYQKTEIQEGAKRIEILEIVECKNKKFF